MSKILTIKSTTIENHYSEVFLSNSDTQKTLSTSYRNLLKLIKNENGSIMVISLMEF